MTDTPQPFRPEPEDSRYDHRLKFTIARAHLKLAEADVYDQALAAIAELAMGKTLDGRPLPGVHHRTQTQAARVLFSSAASVIPKDPIVQIDQRTVNVEIDREAYREALRDPKTRRSASTLLAGWSKKKREELEGKPKRKRRRKPKPKE